MSNCHNFDVALIDFIVGNDVRLRKSHNSALICRECAFAFEKYKIVRTIQPE